MNAFFRTIILLVLLVTLNSMKCEEIIESSAYTSVTMDRDDFENAVTLLPAQPIVKSGKIYIIDELMFVNDVDRGFHVFDYANPSSPLAIGFINIPGATDLTIRNNIIYINQAVDLVTLSYNPVSNQMNVLFRNRNVFPPEISPDGFFYQTDSNKIVLNWIED